MLYNSFSFGLSYIKSKIVDTDYAIKYSEVFGSYDINEVDKYLDEDTLIVYKGMTKTYKELRNNIIKAFNEKKYVMHNDSYGHGNNKFVDGIQEIGVLTYVEYNEKRSEDVILELERKGLFSYRIRSLKSEGRFFGYLFFGIEE